MEHFDKRNSKVGHTHPHLIQGRTHERDRFVGFTFAGGDLLIESTQGGKVTFATGACRALLDTDAISLAGTDLTESFDPAFYQTIHALYSSSEPGARRGPIPMRTRTGMPVDIRLCRLPQDTSNVFFSISQRIPGKQNVITGAREAFFEIATRQVSEPCHKEIDTITVFRLGVDKLDGMPNQAQIEQALDQAVIAYLQANAVNPVGAVRLGGGQYGLVHRHSRSPEDLTRPLKLVCRSIHPTLGAITISSDSVDVTALGDDPEEAGIVLRRVVGQFCHREPFEAVEPGAGSALKTGVEQTRGKISWLGARIEADDLDLHIQPIVDLTTGAVRSYEGLCRFEGNTSPFDIVTFAEDVALVQELDAAVLRRALAMLRQGEIPEGVNLSINISGLSIQSPAFVKNAVALFTAEEAARDRLAFEITESARVDNLQQVRKCVDDLRKAGIPVCLDDFGTGAASFPYLQALDVDCVKIDGVYTARMLQNSRDYHMIKALAELCNNLGISTVAEYVEESVQVDALRALGIQQAQGFLFGKPKPAAEYKDVTFVDLP